MSHTFAPPTDTDKVPRRVVCPQCRGTGGITVVTEVPAVRPRRRVTDFEMSELAYDCSTCGAPAGVWCGTRGNAVLATYLHEPRFRAASREWQLREEASRRASDETGAQ